MKLFTNIPCLVFLLLFLAGEGYGQQKSKAWEDKFTAPDGTVIDVDIALDGYDPKSFFVENNTTIKKFFSGNNEDRGFDFKIKFTPKPKGLFFKISVDNLKSNRPTEMGLDHVPVRITQKSPPSIFAKTTLSVTITNTERELEKFSIPIEYISSNAADLLKECKGKARKWEKLECLQGISTPSRQAASPEISEEINKAEAALISEQGEVNEKWPTIKAEPGDPASECYECEGIDFSVEPFTDCLKTIETSSKTRWENKSKNKKCRFRISIPDWNKGPIEIELAPAPPESTPAKKPTSPPEDKTEKTDEAKADEVKTGETNEVDKAKTDEPIDSNINDNSTPETDTSEGALPPPLQTSIDPSEIYWQDSIVPLLVFDTIFSQAPSLRARLEYFTSEWDGGFREFLAHLILNPYLTAAGGFALIAAVSLLILLKKRTRKKKERKGRETTVKKDKMKQASSDKPPTDQQKDDPEEKTTLARENETSGTGQLPRGTEPTDEHEAEENPSQPRQDAQEEETILISEVETEESEKMDLNAYVAMQKSNDYVAIDLKEYWADSAVHQVYFGKKSIRGISKFLYGQYPGLEKVQAGMASAKEIESMPEIGGFLLGKVFPESGQFEVSVEQFVPITPEKHDRYMVKFGDEAWVELDDAMKAAPNLKLVGWFHTHPDHGVFLSNADLMEQKQLFRQPYQLAMEIDPVKKGMEMGLFSWTLDGQINNIGNKKKHGWWSFVEDLEKKTSA